MSSSPSGPLLDATDSDSDSDFEQYSISLSSASLPLDPTVRGHARASSTEVIYNSLVSVPLVFMHMMKSAKFEYSRCTGNRKAVCIGINYSGFETGYDVLKGCIKDALRMRDYLLDHENFSEDNIRLLVDEATSIPHLMPTRQNILEAIRWLVEGAQENDTLVFHYAGHADQVDDTDKDEIDGKDEALVPSDYSDKKDYITDDVIYKELVLSLPVGCRLTAIMDCCTSGTILDPPFVYRSASRLTKKYKGGAVAHRPRTMTKRLPTQICPDVAVWASCKDSDSAFDKDTLTNAFVDSMTSAKMDNRPSYEAMLQSLRNKVRRKIPHTGKKPKPQFGTYRPYSSEDMARTFFITSHDV
ncbi:hypothetical protein K523DRAFT_96983 [Schizophyllum commune Tattone D]|nr:hypothetical protein K523DRAFT_96983 [Schizophyllum commune Tattone D]